MRDHVASIAARAGHGASAHFDMRRSARRETVHAPPRFMRSLGLIASAKSAHRQFSRPYSMKAFPDASVSCHGMIFAMI